jgi:uncharacterized iron-regulated membrane protein
MRNVFFQLHLWTSMIAGVVLLVLGVTGAVMAFEEPLDHVLNPGLFYVRPQAQRMPIADMVSSLQKAFPRQRVNMIMLGKSPDLAALAVMRGGGPVYLDPYTGQVKGKRKGVGFTQTVHNIHLRLWMGRTGEMVGSVATLVLVFLTLSGIYLWWPLKRVTVATGKSWRRLNFDLHYAAGFYSSLFLLIVSLTGVIVGFSDYTMDWMYKLTNSEPMDSTADSTPVPGAKPISPDRAVEIAQPAMPGATLVSVVFPAKPDASYRVAFRYPEDRTPGGRSRVLVDQYSGEVLLTESSRTAPAGTRLVNLNRALHTGDIGGLPTKILACLTSLSVLVQAFTGVVMWWKRRQGSAQPAAAMDLAAERV